MRSAAPASTGDADVADVLRKLAVVWTDFEGRLAATPLIRKLTRGRLALEDYWALLVNLRQQVKDGALWMSRAASNIDEDHLELRSRLMKHAVTEHRDFRLLEADYVASGGAIAVIRAADKNVGSEALSARMRFASCSITARTTPATSAISKPCSASSCPMRRRPGASLPAPR